MDAFYVSCELQRRPELRGKPVVVAGSGPRAVVTTASYEARRFGVFSATPASRARRLCPDAIFVAPDFDHYRARSAVVMEVLRTHIETVEIVGLDEAYLELTGLDRPKSAARRVKEAVRASTGLSCSMGIGPNKLVAKVASDLDKPDGFVILSRDEARERFAGASPGIVPGIGPKTVERLDARGIATLGRLAAVPEEMLADWFGTNLGPHLGRLARFEGSEKLTLARAVKSESRETTFDYDLRGLDQLEPQLEGLAEGLCERLQRQDRRGRTIGIKVRLADFSTHTRARTVGQDVNDVATVKAVSLELLRELDPREPVRLLGVRVAGLDREPGPAPEGQLELTIG